MVFLGIYDTTLKKDLFLDIINTGNGELSFQGNINTDWTIVNFNSRFVSQVEFFEFASCDIKNNINVPDKDKLMAFNNNVKQYYMNDDKYKIVLLNFSF